MSKSTSKRLSVQLYGNSGTKIVCRSCGKDISQSHFTMCKDGSLFCDDCFNGNNTSKYCRYCRYCERLSIEKERELRNGDDDFREFYECTYMKENNGDENV